MFEVATLSESYAKLTAFCETLGPTIPLPKSNAARKLESVTSEKSNVLKSSAKRPFLNLLAPLESNTSMEAVEASKRFSVVTSSRLSILSTMSEISRIVNLRFSTKLSTTSFSSSVNGAKLKSLILSASFGVSGVRGLSKAGSPWIYCTSLPAVTVKMSFLP